MEPVEYHGDPLRRLTDVDYRSHSCAPECPEHPFSSGHDWSAPIRSVTPQQDEALWRAAEKASDAVEEFMAAHARCQATLFPLPFDPLIGVVYWFGEPVHPDIAARCGHVAGPAPLVCKRQPHADSPWHWNDGTWWR